MANQDLVKSKILGFTPTPFIPPHQDTAAVRPRRNDKPSPMIGLGKNSREARRGRYPTCKGGEGFIRARKVGNERRHAAHRKSEGHASKPAVWGFTTIELLVAMTLFVVLVSIAALGFVNSLRAERSVVSLINVNNNASLALEQMMREMRTGYSFELLSSRELRFTNYKSETVYYRLDTRTINGSSQGFIQRGVVAGAEVNYKDLTSDDINIANLKIILCPDPENPGGCSLDNLENKYPPRITIAATFSTINPSLQGIFTNIQTSVSPRNINI